MTHLFIVLLKHSLFFQFHFDIYYVYTVIMKCYVLFIHGDCFLFSQASAVQMKQNAMLRASRMAAPILRELDRARCRPRSIKYIDVGRIKAMPMPTVAQTSILAQCQEHRVPLRAQ